MNVFGEEIEEEIEEKEEKVDRMKITFDFLNAINYTKEDVFDELGESYYRPFYINRFLSGKIDSILYANEMNLRAGTVEKQMHFDYLQNSLRKLKRYSKWLKGSKDDKVEVIQKFYGYSWKKAREVVDLITEENINTMEKMMDEGGSR